MNKCESKARLLENDQLQQHVFNADTDSESDDFGFSSGYDSLSDPSDSDGSDDANSSFNTPDAEAQCTMSYKNTSALCDHLKYILSMPELCDVTFLVGPTKVPVYGLKAILGTRSRVMYQLILKAQRSQQENASKKKSKRSRINSRLTINVHKYEIEDFRSIVQFIHCGTVDITPSNVSGLLCGASQFGLDDLKTACWNFINICRESDGDSLSVMKKYAQKYSYFKAASRLLTKIQNHENPTTHVAKMEPTYTIPKEPTTLPTRSPSKIETTV